MKWVSFEQMKAYRRLYGSISYMHRKEVGYFEALESLDKIKEEEDSN